MKTRLLLLFLFIRTLSNAQILEITETSSPSHKMIPGHYNVVDINSSLMVELNSDSLIVQISRETRTNQSRIDQLDRLNKVLVQKTEILNLLLDSIRSDRNKNQLNVLGSYSTMMDTFYKHLIQNPDLREQANKLFNKYFDLRDKQTLNKAQYPNPQSYVLQNLSMFETSILDEIAKSDSLSQMNVQVVAFLNTQSAYNQQIHIENFDNVEKGEYYVVNRWVTSFSQEDLEAFNKTEVLASQLNKASSQGFIGLINVLAQHIGSYNCLTELLSKIKLVQKNFGSIEQANIEVLASCTNQMESWLVTLLNELESLTRISSSEQNVLDHFNKISCQFIAKVDQLPDEIDSLFKALPGELLSANQPLVEIKDKATQCVAMLKTDADNIQNTLNYVTNLFIPSKKSHDATQSVDKETLSFQINQLPPFGIIDLKTTGKRGNGDQLQIKVRIKTPQTEAQNIKTSITIDSQTLILQQINVYSESKVSLILASPYQINSKVKIENKFQFSPSGSLLFKAGSRKSKAWNFISPGLGFNMSTPDFNLDGVPDVAMGAVATFLKDMVMVGWSYNTTTDSPFWFFGLSLPFSIPGVPVNSIQTNTN